MKNFGYIVLLFIFVSIVSAQENKNAPISNEVGSTVNTGFNKELKTDKKDGNENLLLSDNALISFGTASVIPEVYDFVLVDVSVEFPANVIVNAMEFSFSYDVNPDFQFAGVEIANTLTEESNGLAEASEYETGKVNVAVATQNSLAENGILLRLIFSVTPNLEEGTYNIKYDNTKDLIINSSVEADYNAINGYVSRIYSLLGDVDLNEIVDLDDAEKIMDFLSNRTALDELQLYNAEVTSNDIITPFDASMIQRYYWGDIDELPHTTPIPATGIIEMPDSPITPEEIISLPIQISGGTSIYSFFSTILYDNNILVLEEIEFPDEYTSYILRGFESEGEIKLLGSASAPNISEGTFVTLKFTLAENAENGGTEVIMKNLQFNENEVNEDVDTSFIDIITDVTEDGPGLPEKFALYQNYPNPFNPSTTIKYSIPAVFARSPDGVGATRQSADLLVQLKVYNALGRKVATLVNQKQSAGNYQVNFDASSVNRRISSGIYFYQIKAGNFTATKKMILMK